MGASEGGGRRGGEGRSERVNECLCLVVSGNLLGGLVGCEGMGRGTVGRRGRARDTAHGGTTPPQKKVSTQSAARGCTQRGNIDGIDYGIALLVIVLSRCVCSLDVWHHHSQCYSSTRLRAVVVVVVESLHEVPLSAPYAVVFSPCPIPQSATSPAVPVPPGIRPAACIAAVGHYLVDLLVFL